MQKDMDAQGLRRLSYVSWDRKSENGGQDTA